jgi:hypothetical protein
MRRKKKLVSFTDKTRKKPRANIYKGSKPVGIMMSNYSKILKRKSKPGDLYNKHK